MKKYVTIFTFFMAFMLGSQFVNAQEGKLTVKEIEVKAQKDTEKLNELVGLEEEQQEKVYQVFYEMETNMNAINQDEKAAPRIPIVMEAVDNKLSKILNSKQYQIYLDNKE